MREVAIAARGLLLLCFFRSKRWVERSVWPKKNNIREGVRATNRKNGYEKELYKRIVGSFQRSEKSPRGFSFLLEPIDAMMDDVCCVALGAAVGKS